jgi:predicted MFS family arabinose efflux permease
MDRRLLVLALGMSALGTDSFVISGVLPQISEGFHVSIGAAGQMTTFYAVTYALMAPTIATVAAHIPRKTLLLSSLTLFVIANLLTAAAPTLGFALVARVLAGLGAAMFAPTATGAAAAMVPPEKRGFALSVVLAGLTGALALGSPIGAVIGGLGDWRWTMLFVSALAVASGTGVWALLSHIALPPKVSLTQRIAPIADPRVALSLACSFLYQTGQFITYTYFTVVFDRVLGGKTLLTGALLVLFGICASASNLVAGRLTDSIGTHKVIVTMLVVLGSDLALFPWSGAHLWTAIIAVAVWGAASWSILGPVQHRLVSLAPQSGPVLLGLNTSCTYLGVTSAGLIGALGVQTIGGHYLGFIGAAFVVISIGFSELATWRINVTKGARSKVTNPLVSIALPNPFPPTPVIVSDPPERSRSVDSPI